MRSASLLLALIYCSGCAVGPDFRPPTAQLPTAWQSTSQSFDASSIDSNWWKRFNDPTLDALVTQALASNADVQVAALRVAQSRAQRGAVAGAAWPSVSASVGYQRERQSENGVATRMIDLIAPAANRDQIITLLSEPFSVYQAGFDAAWELDLWGRVRRSVESADAAALVSEEDLHDAQLSLIAEVVRTYLELRGVQDQQRIAQTDVAAGEDLVELTEFRVKGGIVDSLDLAAQRTRLADSRATLPTLAHQRRQLASALELTLNAAPGSLEEQLKDIPSPATPPLSISAGVPSDVARRRPDIRRAEARLHAATADIGVARGDLYPRFTLTGSFVQQSLEAADVIEWGSRQWSIGPSLSLPIFDGGRRRAVVVIRELQQQQAAIAYQRTVLGAWHEIENAMSGYAAEQERNRELERALASSHDAYDVAHVRYAHGLINYLAELDARRTLLQAERAYSQSNTQLATRLVALYKALGGGWQT